MDNKIFTQLGLNNTEVKVYLALLKLDGSTVGPIIKEAKISDSKIYFILNTLKEKGLVNYFIKNNVKHYQANDPNNLLYIIDKKENDLNNLKLELKKRIIPEIEARKKEKEDKQEAFVYESMNGIKSAFIYMLDTLKKGETYDVFAHDDQLLANKEIINFFNQHHKRRIERGIKVRLLYPENNREIFRRLYENKYQQYKSYKYISEKLPLGTYIFKNHVMNVIWGDNPTAFVIKSNVNYERYRSFFEDLWKRTR